MGVGTLRNFALHLNIALDFRGKKRIPSLAVVAVVSMQASTAGLVRLPSEV